jgi:hypothetical protein
MSGPDLDDRLDHLLRAVAAGVTAGDPAAVARRGRRRRLARRAAGAAVVAALLVGVVLVPTVLPDQARRPATPSVVTGPPVDGIPDGVVPWSGARGGEKPRQLTVTVQAGGGAASQPSDPCWEGYQPEARSEPDRVVVTVRRFRSRVPLAEGHGCADFGLMWNVTVDLPDDLRGRQVVDGATGRSEEVVTGLLAPLWLPRGWGLLHETGGDGARWQREYGPKPGPTPSDSRGPRHPELLEPADQVTVVEVPPRLLPTWNRWPDNPVVAHPVVRGFRAEVDWSEADRVVNLRWREGDRAYVVSGQARNGAQLRGVQELVVAIAGGLRRPCEPPPLILDSYPPQFREADGGATPDQRGCR